MTMAVSTSRCETSRSWGPWVLAASLALVAGSASAAIYVVRPDGTGDFPSIQRAVDAAVDGDVIELTDGTFERIRNRDIDFLGKAITIRSQSGDPTRCIIDCGGSVSAPHRGFLFAHGEGNDSVLEGVTVQNGYGPDEDGFSMGGAVLCKGASPTIRSCRFVRNGAIMGGAIASTYNPSSTLQVEDCVIAYNTAALNGGGGAILAIDGAPTVRGCTIVGNSCELGAAILFTGGLPAPVMTIENCIIAFNSGSRGVECLPFADVLISCSDIFGNEGGDWVGCASGQSDLRGNLALDPLFCGLDGEFRLHEISPCAPAANPECGLIGAQPVACGDPVAVERSSWGRIKSTFNPRTSR